jgi:hypothetical protein
MTGVSGWLSAGCDLRCGAAPEDHPSRHLQEEKKGRLHMSNLTLTEIGRDVYGHDERAINLHSTRTYRDQHGNLYVLSRTLDGIPPFFEAYGPYRQDHCGVLPRLRVNGLEYWGDGWSWQRATRAFQQAVQEMQTGKENACQNATS